MFITSENTKLMETNRNRNGHTEPTTKNAGNHSRHNPASPNGFEGMNFEEQRANFKNSDGAGVRGPEKGNRNGSKNRH